MFEKYTVQATESVNLISSEGEVCVCVGGGDVKMKPSNGHTSWKDSRHLMKTKIKTQESFCS